MRKLPLLLVVVALAMAIPSFAEFYTDWLWFTEVGFEQVFLRSLSAQATVGTLTGLAAFVLFFVNLRVALHAMRPREIMIATAQGPQVIAINPRRLKPLVGLAAVVGGVLFGIYGGSHWETWLFYLHRTPFGKVDPILGHDIGFYVFT